MLMMGANTNLNQLYAFCSSNFCYLEAFHAMVILLCFIDVRRLEC